MSSAKEIVDASQISELAINARYSQKGTSTRRPVSVIRPASGELYCALFAPAKKRSRESPMKAAYSKNDCGASRFASITNADDRKLPTTKPALSAASTPEQ